MGSNGHGAVAPVMERPVGQVVIRLAGEADLPACVDGIVAMRADTLWQHIPFEPNRRHILTTLLAYLATPVHRLIVAERDGAIIGLCGGQLTTARFIPDVPVLLEWAWWVAPEYRQETPSIGWKLWMELMTWARDAGAVGAIYGKAKPLTMLRASTPFETMVWFPLRRPGPQEAA